jgi:hypothetical protein
MNIDHSRIRQEKVRSCGLEVGGNEVLPFF